MTKKEMKTKTNVFEKNGRFYVQHSVWCEKFGYYIPQSPKRISKKEYERFMKADER